MLDDDDVSPRILKTCARLSARQGRRHYIVGTMHGAKVSDTPSPYVLLSISPKGRIRFGR